jgi:acyl-CoA hydrolase
VIAYADGADSPRSSPKVVAAAAGVEDTEVLLGWTVDPSGWLSSPDLRGRTALAGYALSSAVAAGRLQYLPARLSAMPRLLAGPLRPDVAVVSAVRRGNELVYGATVGWGPAAIRSARVGVVVEVDPGGADLGGPPIEGHILAVIDRPPPTEASPVPRAPDDVERAIGRNVVSVLPDQPTLQFGPGGVAEAILTSIDRPVGIWSGLVTDSVADLHERGLLQGTATAAYAWGTKGVASLADRGRLRLVPVDETHDISGVAAIDGLVGCNTALQVALDGSVNIERVGGRYVAGIGGHADFCAAAVHSRGGLSVIALRSTTRAGQSTIVPSVEVVSTPRCDVEVVVTEHGIADLRGVDDRERARRIASVAAPQHRDYLESVGSH